MKRSGELPASEPWATRYEELRRQVLAEPQADGWGRALLLRRGRVAWMQAWPTPACAGQQETKPAAPATEAAPLPAGLSGELTRVLVNMILEQGKELFS